MPLVSPAQISALRTIAFRGLDTPFTVWRPTRSDNGYGTDAITYVEVGSGLCWLRMMNSPHLHEEVAQELGTSVYRMHTTPDVAIDVSDQIRIGTGLGEIRYIVQDTNFDDTIQIFRTAILRRVG